MVEIIGLIGVSVVLVLLIGYILVRCPRGGFHQWAVARRVHGQWDVTRGPWKATVDGYVELVTCPKCDAKKAYKWVDMGGSHGDRQETDVAHVEELLRGAGAAADGNARHFRSQVSLQQVRADERARIHPLLCRALDAVRSHDFSKGHEYDRLCGDLRAEISRKG
jgi:hypothetical protein